MPTDSEITFADHMGRFYARRFSFPPIVGRLIGYLAVCDPPDPTIGELMDRVRITAQQSMQMDVSEYEEMGELAREGLEVLGDAPPERRAALLEMSAFADFLVEELPRLKQEWEARRQALVASGDLPETRSGHRRQP